MRYKISIRDSSRSAPNRPRSRMDSNPRPAELSSDPDYTFAFNDRSFSDRILSIKVFPDLAASNPRGKVQKRRKLETTGDEVVHTVKTIYVSSPILAAKSPYFLKLFSNGMMESNQQEVPLKIHVSEEAAFMDLLKFIYSGDLAATTAPDLLKVLIAADKFEVTSCTNYCSRLLRNLPVTCESALLYLHLPSSVSMGKVVQSLTDTAKQFLATHYNDLTKFHEEVLNLPLLGIEAVLSSDDLLVTSEDAVVDFLLKWAKKHYPNLFDRQKVFDSHLIQLIRFPYLTCWKLASLLTCIDIPTELVSNVVINTLIFKADTYYRHEFLAEGSCRHFIARAYRHHPVKVVELEFPRLHCFVYLELKRDRCLQLCPSGNIYSERFYFGGQFFHLRAAYCKNQQDNLFGMSLGTGKCNNESVSCAVEYEFSVGSKLCEEYIKKCSGNFTSKEGQREAPLKNLYGVAWSVLMAENSPFFTNDSLHIRAKITLKR